MVVYDKFEYETLTRASNKPPKLWATKKSGRILSYSIVSDVLVQISHNRKALVFFVISKQSLILKHL